MTLEFIQLVILIMSFVVSLPIFPKFLSNHLDTFFLDKSRMQGHKSSLPSPSPRNVFAARHLEGLVLPLGQRVGLLTTLKQ